MLLAAASRACSTGTALDEISRTSRRHGRDPRRRVAA